MCGAWRSLPTSTRSPVLIVGAIEPDMTVSIGGQVRRYAIPSATTATAMTAAAMRMRRPSGRATGCCGASTRPAGGRMGIAALSIVVQVGAARRPPRTLHYLGYDARLTVATKFGFVGIVVVSARRRNVPVVSMPFDAARPMQYT